MDPNENNPSGSGPGRRTAKDERLETFESRQACPATLEEYGKDEDLFDQNYNPETDAGLDHRNTAKVKRARKDHKEEKAMKGVVAGTTNKRSVQAPAQLSVVDMMRKKNNPTGLQDAFTPLHFGDNLDDAEEKVRLLLQNDDNNDVRRRRRSGSRVEQYSLWPGRCATTLCTSSPFGGRGIVQRSNNNHPQKRNSSPPPGTPEEPYRP